MEKENDEHALDFALHLSPFLVGPVAQNFMLFLYWIHRKISSGEIYNSK
jgi:hypothetical protein